MAVLNVKVQVNVTRSLKLGVIWKGFCFISYVCNAKYEFSTRYLLQFRSYDQGYRSLPQTQRVIDLGVIWFWKGFILHFVVEYACQIQSLYFFYTVILLS